MNHAPNDLRGHYSLAWMNMGTLVLLTNIIGLIPFYSIMDHVFQSTESQIKAVCAQINASAHHLDQFPVLVHQHLEAIHHSLVEHLRKAMVGTVSVVQAVVLWCVDIYKSTYRCLIAFAIHSLMGVFTWLAAPIQAATEAVLTTLDQAADALFDTHPSLIPKRLANWTHSIEEAQVKVSQWTNGTSQIQQWLSIPFESLKQHINVTLTGPVNDNATLFTASNVTYCNPTPVVDDLHSVHAKIRFTLNVIIGILLGAIFLCTVATLVYLRYHGCVDCRFRPVQRWYRLTQFHAMRFCLGLSIVGLVTTYSLIHGIPSSASMRTLDMTPHIFGSHWEATNLWIAQSEATINDQLFASIRAFAVPINNTLESVIQHLSDLITETVGDTLLEEPAKEVLNCLILNKLDTLQNGVEWIVSERERERERKHEKETDGLLLKIEGGGVSIPRLQKAPLPLTIPLQDFLPSILTLLTTHLHSQAYLYWALLCLWVLGSLLGLVYINLVPTDKSSFYSTASK